MKFKTGVLNTPALAHAYRPGLKALKDTDAAHIICEKKRLLTGSADVDTALKQAFPNMPRWDYAVGIKHDQNTDAVIWIEVHPASSTGEVKTVLAKLKWLKEWASAAAPNLMRLHRKYVWIATGRVAFSLYSKQRKLLAMAGLEFSGSQYRIKTG